MCVCVYIYIYIEQRCKQIFTYTLSHTVNNESHKGEGITQYNSGLTLLHLTMLHLIFCYFPLVICCCKYDTDIV
jgi:hypothetical protein